jgi:glycosyltransferase involved in cell wall biosynthesis
LVGDLTFASFREELWRAAVVVVPARRSLHGSGQTAALHAMAARKPVVMTDTGWAAAHGLVAGEHFVDVPPEDSEAMRSALLQLLDDEEEAARLGNRAASAVRDRFTPERQANALLGTMERS